MSERMTPEQGHGRGSRGTARRLPYMPAHSRPIDRSRARASRPGEVIAFPPVTEPVSEARARQIAARRDMMGADGHASSLRATLGLDGSRSVEKAEAEAELSGYARRDLTATRCGLSDRGRL